MFVESALGLGFEYCCVESWNIRNSPTVVVAIFTYLCL